MSTDDKIRYGLMALTGASVVLTTMGAHFGPLTGPVSGWGGS